MALTSLAQFLPDLAQLVAQLRLQFDSHYGGLLQSGVRQQWGRSGASVGRFDQALWAESIVVAVVALMDWQWAVVLLLVGQVCKQQYLSAFTAGCGRNHEGLAVFAWGEVQQRSREVLEYVKFERMVRFGYELRSNTNLILLEEAQSDRS